MDWKWWRNYFETNADRPDWVAAATDPLDPSLRPLLATSLAKFQLGETGEGRIVAQVRAAVRRGALPGADPDYVEALRLFVAEEGRHAKTLGTMLRTLGGSSPGGAWSASAFRGIRGIFGPRIKLAVLLVAEVVALVFYGLLQARLPPGRIREGLAEIARDEGMHLRFHAQFFHHQLGTRLGARAWAAGFAVACMAACAVVAFDHRKTLRALGVGPTDLALAVRGAVAWTIDLALTPPAVSVAYGLPGEGAQPSPSVAVARDDERVLAGVR